MNEKRFELYSDDYFVGAYDNVTQEKINVLKSIDLLNSLVEENEKLKEINKDKEQDVLHLYKENEQLRKENEVWQKENRELNSIKKFAEKNGINIFLINEAFRKCWKDNGKLFEENEQLRQRNRKLYKCALYGKTVGDEI